MKSLGTLGIAFSAVAASCCTWLVFPALPKNPAHLPWPAWVAWLSLAVAFLTFMGWFLGLWQATNFAASVRHRAIRGTLYVCAVVLGGLSSLALLAPSYMLFAACRVTNNCGAPAEGVFHILHVMGFELHFGVALLVSLAFVGVAYSQLPQANSHGKNA